MPFAEPRDRSMGPTRSRLGRAPLPRHYYIARFCGTMRTRPDLLNIGARHPSRLDLGHLFSRCYVPVS